jgi:Single-strand binding protein family
MTICMTKSVIIISRPHLLPMPQHTAKSDYLSRVRTMQCCPRSNSAIGSQTRPVPAPEQRTSKAGKPFVKATLKAKDGDTAQWWKVLAFSDSVQAELVRLADGDTISVQGAFKAELYEKDGEKRLSLSIVADHVFALRQPSAPRKLGKKPQTATPANVRTPRVDYDDAIPFG